MKEDSVKSIYEWLGGEPMIRRLVGVFYPKVKKDPLLAPLFPEDVSLIMEKQALFLTQFFGGPALYSDSYGHPMMRARHMPFAISSEHADAWLRCMRSSLEDVGVEDQLLQVIMDRLQGTAYHFINVKE